MANLRVDKITSTETFETTGSVQFDGANSGLTISDNTDFDLGTGDFTIEGWYYIENVGVYLSLFDWRGSGGDGNYPALFRNNTGNYIYYYVNSTVRITNVNIDYNTWFHVTVCRSSGITRLFLNGKEKGSFVDNTNYISRDILLGLSQSSSNDLKGHISNYRVIKGKALYTEDFTPPTRELTVTPETVLLACQHKTDASHEKTGKTITVNGNAVANELTPGLLTDVVKSGGNSAITGSVEFDGTGDYLSIPNSSDLRLNQATEDFTIECWANTSKSSGQFIVGLWETTNNRRSWILWFDQTGGPKPAFVWSTTGSNTTGLLGSAVKKNEWYHIAVVKSSSTIKLYVNGVEEASNSSVTQTFFAATTDNIQIGADWTNARYLQGFISNLRIVKGTALYTSNFIPPTRELKKVPGTVLLCCQDSNDPTTEATGKTITGYGDLVQVGISTNLADSGSYTNGSTGSGVATFVNNVGIITGTDSSNRGILHKTVPVIKGNKYEFSFRSTDASTNGKAGVDSNDGTSDVLDDVTNAPDLVYFSGSTVPNLDTTTGTFKQIFTATTNEAVIYFQEIGPGTLQVTDISLTAIDGRKGSNFTPQVGNDGSVEFVGPTKINTENYFYLPTGDTVTRDSRSGRGLFGGSNDGSPFSNTINYITISTSGNSQDFGDLTEARSRASSYGSTTRGVWAGGNPVTNTIDYVTISTTSNAFNFGDLTVARRFLAGTSSSTRGISGGGNDGGGSPYPSLNVIDYTTISSTGDAVDFGDLLVTRSGLAALSSPTRALFAGGYSSGLPAAGTNDINYVTIASTGNAVNFGTLSAARRYLSGCSSNTRGVFGSGSAPGVLNTIDYVTIASTGNAVDFGDATISNEHRAAMSNSIRGVWAGLGTPVIGNTIDYITIATTGNAQDFGDCASNTGYSAGCSDSHGGLG